MLATLVGASSIGKHCEEALSLGVILGLTPLCVDFAGVRGFVCLWLPALRVILGLAPLCVDFAGVRGFVCLWLPALRAILGLEVVGQRAIN